MNQKKPSQDKELLAIVERFEAMQKEGKTLYLDAEEYQDLVEYYVYEKEYQKASEAIERGLQIHPDDTRLIATKVALYIDEEKIIEAREILDQVADDNSFHIRLINAELLVVEGKEEEAKEAFDSFKTYDTDEMDCLDIGLLCNDVGFNDQALYWLDKCLEINPENEEAILGLSECYQALGEYEKTIGLYNRLIDKDPYSAEYWSGLGKSYFYLGDFGKAIEACDFALVSDEKSGEAYTIKGHAYYQLENYEEAVKAYKEAWRLGSLDTEFAPMFIAFCYIGMEEWDNAYEYLKKAIARTNENSPVFPDLLINSARCLNKMNRYDEAHSTLEFTLERFPENIVAYIYNAQYYLQENNREKALQNFDKAVEVSPTADTWYQVGLTALNSDEYELARVAFENVQELDPNHEDLAQNMEYVLNKLTEGQYLSTNRETFKQHIKKIVRTTGELPQTYDIDEFAKQAKAEGKSPEEIAELVEALKQLNDLLENFDDEEDGKGPDEDNNNK